MMASPLPILYSFRRCPYAMRARMALRQAGLSYEHREVALRDKPQAMLDVSPKGTVPIFVLPNGQVLEESLAIMDHVGRAPHGPIVDMIDEAFKYHLDRYKYRSRYDPDAKRGDVDLSERAKAVACLGQIEARLTDQPYLNGATQGPLDLATFPFVRQFAAVEPDWWATEPLLVNTRNWLAANLASQLFQSIMTKHPIWTPDSPALILP